MNVREDRFRKMKGLPCCDRSHFSPAFRHTVTGSWFWFFLLQSSQPVVAERYCFYRCLSVQYGGCHQPSMPAGPYTPLSRHPPRADTSPQVWPPPTNSPPPHTHTRWPLQQTARILLEWILVFVFFLFVSLFLFVCFFPTWIYFQLRDY